MVFFVFFIHLHLCLSFHHRYSGAFDLARHLFLHHLLVSVATLVRLFSTDSCVSVSPRNILGTMRAIQDKHEVECRKPAVLSIAVRTFTHVIWSRVK